MVILSRTQETPSNLMFTKIARHLFSYLHYKLPLAILYILYDVQVSKW